MDKIIGGTYVVGDIHGRYDEWMKMKQDIEKEDPEAKFILVGDIEDRGHKSYEMIKWAMENITENGKYQMIKGNHEDGKVDWWKRAKAFFVRRNKGTKDFDYTKDCLPERYGFNEYMKEAMVSTEKMEEIITWMDNLPLYKKIIVNNQRFIIVHANMPPIIFEAEENKKFDSEWYIDDYFEQLMLWNRAPFGFYSGIYCLEDVILVNGHTPTIALESFPYDKKVNVSDFGRILKTRNRYNIDCGAGYLEDYECANLAILRLDDFKEYYFR